MFDTFTFNLVSRRILSEIWLPSAAMFSLPPVSQSPWPFWRRHADLSLTQVRTQSSHRLGKWNPFSANLFCFLQPIWKRSYFLLLWCPMVIGQFVWSYLLDKSWMMVWSSIVTDTRKADPRKVRLCGFTLPVDSSPVFKSCAALFVWASSNCKDVLVQHCTCLQCQHWAVHKQRGS